MRGEENSQQRRLLNSILKIEEKNRDTLNEYRTIANAQNPVYSVINDSKKRILPLTSLYEGAEAREDGEDFSIFPKDETQIRIIGRLQALLEGRRPEDDDVWDKKMRKYYSDDNNLDDEMENVVPILKKDEILRDINLLELEIKIKKLETHHNNAMSLSHDIMIKAFQTKGSPSLEEVVYQDGQDKSETKVNHARLRQALTRGIKGIGNKHLSQEMQDEILGVVVSKFAEGGKLSGAFTHLDTTLLERQSEGVPPDIRIEESFQKMLEDEIYNAVMKHNSGTKRFAQVDGILSDDGDIIDVNANTVNNRYLPIGMIKGGIVEDNAIGIHNLNALFEKIDEGESSISKEEAQKIINEEIPFFKNDSNSKSAIWNKIESMYGKKQLSQTLYANGQAYDTSKEIGDFKLRNRADRYVNSRYINKGPFSLDGLARKLNIFRKSAVDLISCLKKAENPTIRHHAAAGEVSGCLDNAMKKIEQSLSENQKALSSPLVAMGGMAWLFVIFDAFDRGRHAELYSHILMANLERSQALDFLDEALTPVEEEARGRAIVGEDNAVESFIVAKENEDEYLYGSIKAKHDYHKEYNPYLRKNGQSIISSILNASSTESVAAKTIEALKSIEGQNAIVSKGFHGFISDRNDVRLSSFEKEKLRLLSAMSQGDNGAFKDFSMLLKYAKKHGITDIYSIQEDCVSQEAFARNTLKGVKLNLEQLNTQLESLNAKVQGFITNGNEDDLHEVRVEISEIKAKIESEVKKSEELTASLEILRSLYVEVEEIIDNTEDFVLKKHAEAGEKPPSKEEIKKAVSFLLSQKNAFKFLNAKDSKNAEDCFKARYHSTNASESLFQDLSAVDEQMDAIHNSKHLSMKQKESALSNLTAMKVVMREAYITSRINENKTLSRNQVLKSLFKLHSRDMISTSDVSFGVISQPGGDDIQIITATKTKDKEVNAWNIKQVADDGMLDKEDAVSIITAFENATGISVGSRAQPNHHSELSQNQGLTTNSRIELDKKKDHKRFLKEQSMDTDSPSPKGL